MPELPNSPNANLAAVQDLRPKSTLSTARSDDAVRTADDGTVQPTSTSTIQVPVEIDEIESRIDVFVGTVLEVSPRYSRAGHVIERLVETRLMNEVDELKNIASRLRIDLAFVPHAHLEENQDEN